eukprot:TRINITY_DN20822_c0_g1_i1.p1 TRINITY_DN20822_c0_g1~~TRINITY_DN20822_c0_g1_i1.p1  ORF type:complete len:1546 (+),score=252.12 TRINITY_DN20822_c0_g1_i1:115-4752(+)
MARSLGSLRCCAPLAAAAFLALAVHAVGVAPTALSALEAPPPDFGAQLTQETRSFLGQLRAELVGGLAADAAAVAPLPCRVQAYFNADDVDETQAEPCRKNGAEDRSLGSALLHFLRRRTRDGDSGGALIIEEAEAEAPEAPSWPCTLYAATAARRTDLAEGRRGRGGPTLTPGLRAALWSGGLWLRRCGVSGLRKTWPTNDAEWSSLRSDVADALQALASSRSDGASIMCARKLQGGSSGDGVHREAVEAANVENDDEQHDKESSSKRLRCPRCARAVAADRGAQIALEEFRRRLLDAEWEPAVSRNQLAQDADCVGLDRGVEAQLRIAWNGGGINALITASETLQCGMCELAGVRRFRDSGIDDQHAAFAAASLVEVRCAAEAPELVDMDAVSVAVTMLERVVWSGLGYPLLQDAASKAMLELLRAGRLTTLIASTSIADSLCGNTSRGMKAIDADFPPRSSLELLHSSSVDSAAWLPHYEQWALSLWGNGDASNPMRMALAYLDLAAATSLPVQSAASLATAGLWMNDAASSLEASIGSASGHSNTPEPPWLHASSQVLGTTGVTDVMALSRAFSDAASYISSMACKIASTLLAPGAQFLILKSSVRVKYVKKRLWSLAGQLPFWTPPTGLVADVLALTFVAKRLHQIFAGRLRTLDSQEFQAWPGAETVALAAPVGVYEAALVEGRSSAARLLHPTVADAALKATATTDGATEATLQVSESKNLPTLRQEAFVEVRGVRLSDFAAPEILLERPRLEKGSQPAFSAALASSILSEAIERTRGVGGASLHATLESPANLPPLFTSQFRYPFQRLAGQGEAARAVLCLQRLLAEAAEASSQPSESALHALPADLREAAKSLAAEQRSLVGSSTRRNELPVLVLRCSEIPAGAGESGDVRFSSTGVEAVVRGSQASPAMHGFAASLTRYLATHSGSLNAEFARLKQTCSMQAAAQVLSSGAVQAKTQQIQTREEEAGSRQPVPSRQAWTERLAGIHAMALNALGFSDLDPGRCWDEVFSFASCCSVGDYASECWQRGFTVERCCGGLVAKGLADEPAVLGEVADGLAGGLCRQPPKHLFTQAIAAWLREPTGRGSDGLTLSGAIVTLLDAEALSCSAMGSSSSFAAEVAHSTGIGAGVGDARKEGKTNGSWVMAPWLGRALRFEASLEPRVQPLKTSVGELRDDVTSLTLHELTRRAELSVTSEDVLESASASPLVRTLQLLSNRFWRLRSRTTAADDEPMASGSDGRAKSSQWILLQPSEAAALRSGQRVRISRAGSLALGSRAVEEGDILDVLESAETERSQQQRKVHRIQLVKGKQTRYYDLTDSAWAVSILRPVEPGVQGLVRSNVQSRQDQVDPASSWPECVAQGESIKGIDGGALFVNLLGLGMREGCFREDCSHTDHFSCVSPATCARTCASLRACRFWTFWAAHSGGICWLRRSDTHRMPMFGGASGAADCVPPARGGDSLLDGKREPTLFDLARAAGASIGPEHPLHQWDLVQVLKEYGHKSPSQVEVSDASSLRRSALRFARRAQRLAVTRSGAL